MAQAAAGEARASPWQICMQSVPLKRHVSFVYSLRCLFLSVRSFDIGDDRCLWGGGGGGGDAGKKTIFDCLWVKADSSRQGGLQRLAGGAVSKSQPLLYP